MLGRTHFLFGLFLGIVFFLSGAPLWVIFFIPFATLVLDVDEPHSLVGRKLKVIGYLFSHRGFFHSVWFLLLSFLIADYFSRTLAFSILIAYTSHLVLDATSKAGISPLWPFRWKIKGPVRVGKWEEHIFLLVILASTLLLLFTTT